MGIISGKRILVTGVLTDASLAYSIAELALKEGAEVVLSGAGRGLSLTQRMARRLDPSIEVIEIDVSRPETAQSALTTLKDRWNSLDGLVHAIGYAPEACLGHGIMAADWSDVATAIEISAFSLKLLAKTFHPLLRESASPSIVGLDFDAAVAWPTYDWMGVTKAAFESLSRYLARDLGADGIRVNLIAAGPIRTVAAKSIPKFERFEQAWAERAPLGWDVNDASLVARSVIALLSDWFPLTTGEIIHADGGFHAVGA
ncbi:MAG: enoyl-ACP reductase FabI [Acidimicrobiales bacterium]|nr:enoyl-ACP reductase FabI [Acidimicrobiales bacterium]